MRTVAIVAEATLASFYCLA